MGLLLPRWVWIGAVALSGVAGMVNVVGYLGSEHQVVSHLTGTTSLLGVALVQDSAPEIGFLWGILIAFCAGAMLSGLIIQDDVLRLDSATARRCCSKRCCCWPRFRCSSCITSAARWSPQAPAGCRTPWPPPSVAPRCAPRT